jgi:hypothetical protein
MERVSPLLDQVDPFLTGLCYGKAVGPIMQFAAFGLVIFSSRHKRENGDVFNPKRLIA